MALGLLRIPQVVALVFGGRERPFSKCHASAVRLRGPEALALAARDGEGGAFNRPQSRCGGGSKVRACSQPVWSLEHG